MNNINLFILPKSSTKYLKEIIMKKVKVILVIDQLHAFVDSLIDLIPTLENQHTQYKIEQLSHIDSTLAK